MNSCACGAELVDVTTLADNGDTVGICPDCARKYRFDLHGNMIDTVRVPGVRVSWFRKLIRWFNGYRDNP